ncbi:MAG: prepilin-type N-terminal cleavage/methylation domain-containing protein, partial [Lentisphaerae bacterium]
MLYRTQSRYTFSLIELLVVISVIAILASILLPVLGRAKQQAIRTFCRSNLKQCAIADFMYSDDNKHLFPGVNLFGSTDNDRTFLNTYVGYDLRTYIKPYIEDYNIWKCPNMAQAKPLDDPGNSNPVCYSTFQYFPGNTYPEFNGSGSPARLRDCDTPSTQPLMEDTFYVKDMGSGNARYCHGEGRRDVKSGNSANEKIKSASASLAFGANISFYDGHAQWYSFRQLTFVGKHAGSLNWV